MTNFRLVIPTIEALLAPVERLGGQKSHLGCRPRCGSQIAGTLGMSLSLSGPHFFYLWNLSMCHQQVGRW